MKKHYYLLTIVLIGLSSLYVKAGDIPEPFKTIRLTCKNFTIKEDAKCSDIKISGLTKGNCIRSFEVLNDSVAVVSLTAVEKSRSLENLKIRFGKKVVKNSKGKLKCDADLLIWSDEFSYNGLPDPQKWGYEKGMVRNKELQYYTEKRAENARVENGNLILELKKEAYKGADYTSASIITRYKADWLYCKIDVSAKLPEGLATWPAIWCLSTDDSYGKWPKSGEIDIMEHVGFQPGTIHANIHTFDTEKVSKLKIKQKIQVPSYHTDYHVYNLDWNENQMKIGVDHNYYLSFSNPKTDYEKWPFDQQAYLILNIAYGGAWGGMAGIDDSIFENGKTCQMLVDYVRVYKPLTIEAQ